MDLISNSIRAVPFKYTWEGGTPLISDPPPIEEKKNPPTTTRIYFNKYPTTTRKKNHKNNFLYRETPNPNLNEIKSLALMIYQYTVCKSLP
jgi:hypothetical protein